MPRTKHQFCGIFNLNLIRKKHQTNPNWGIFYNNWPVFFKSVKAMQDNETLRNCSRLKETKKPSKFSAVWPLICKGHLWESGQNLNKTVENNRYNSIYVEQIIVSMLISWFDHLTMVTQGVMSWRMWLKDTWEIFVLILATVF